MAFENRKGRSYYYRKERDGSRVRSVYIGTGETAQIIAQFDSWGDTQRQEARELEARRRESILAIDRELDALAQIVKQITDASLIAKGYHRHKRQWRRKRA